MPYKALAMLGVEHERLDRGGAQQVNDLGSEARFEQRRAAATTQAGAVQNQTTAVDPNTGEITQA